MKVRTQRVSHRASDSPRSLRGGPPVAREKHRRPYYPVSLGEEQSALRSISVLKQAFRQRQQGRRSRERSSPAFDFSSGVGVSEDFPGAAAGVVVTAFDFNSGTGFPTAPAGTPFPGALVTGIDFSSDVGVSDDFPGAEAGAVVTTFDFSSASGFATALVVAVAEGRSATPLVPV